MESNTQTLAILFADIGGSTALYDRVGDAEAHRQVANSLSLMREAIVANRGTLLRTVGDSSLASFECCDDAWLASREMQVQHASGTLSVRIGFHLGPVIPDGGDVYGNAVNIAARISSFARTGEIATTEEAVNTLSAEHQSRACRLDSIRVKGVTDPIVVYRLDWQEQLDTSVTMIAQARPSVVGLARASRLVLIAGSKQLVLDKPEQVITLGRAEENDLAVVSDHASRQHAKLEISHGQCLFSDNSTNGTYVVQGELNPVFVRRDTIVLDGNGQLGLGALPGTDDDEYVSFSVHAL